MRKTTVLGLLICVLICGFAASAAAQKKRLKPKKGVPELSTGAATRPLLLLGGAVLMIGAERRRRRPV